MKGKRDEGKRKKKEKEKERHIMIFLRNSSWLVRGTRSSSARHAEIGQSTKARTLHTSNTNQELELIYSIHEMGYVTPSQDVLREFASHSRQPRRMGEEAGDAESVVVKGVSSLPLTLSTVMETSILSVVYSSHEGTNRQDHCCHLRRAPRTSCYRCTRPWLEPRRT